LFPTRKEVTVRKDVAHTRVPAPRYSLGKSSSVSSHPDTAESGKAIRLSDGIRLLQKIPYWQEVVVLVIGFLDVILVVPPEHDTLSTILSYAAAGALLFRNRYPFVVALITLPGFFYGWSQLAAMLALGTLAYYRGRHWMTYVGIAGVWIARFVRFPISDFTSMNWQAHLLDAIYGCIVAGMPVAIGLFTAARKQLRSQLAQLAVAHQREEELQAIAIRADERTKIARDMHDVVSHKVTLIAMQAGALQVTSPDETTAETAEVIRKLCTSTLNELRSLVGLLRSTEDMRHELSASDIQSMTDELGINATITVRLTEGFSLPSPVTTAAYRIIQESLTNILKYAPGAATLVDIHHAGGALNVKVSNSANASHIPVVVHSGKHGLAGLAERATLLGGTLHAGPREDGGFEVHAALPCAEQVAPHALVVPDVLAPQEGRTVAP
jgi:signal transduction histidine kinase